MYEEGKLTWPDGSFYEGQLWNGIQSGWGAYSNTNGSTYAGDWVNGMPEGMGKIWYHPVTSDTDLYDGEWKGGVPHGIGTRIYANGDRYTGQWVSGVREGKGSMVWLQERQIYKGEWKNGIPNGKGQHTWFLERYGTSQFAARHLYQGEWVDGVMEGNGRMIYPNGSWVEGHWHDGQRHGKAIFVNSSGEMMIGLFRAGAIIGGTNVTLQAPSYQCDFAGLMRSLTGTLGLNELEIEVSTETETLQRTTKRCLAQIRELYERAGKLGHWWGAPGHRPDWLQSASGDGDSHNERPPSNVQPPESLTSDKSKGKPTPTLPYPPGKFLSPDNVYPVTRFGLWLLMKDCPGILSSVTTAEFDKIWSSMATISFQTRHNPFEPVYLWQFMQCLVVIATVLYIEIPHRRKKLNFGVEPLSTATESETNLASGARSSWSNEEGVGEEELLGEEVIEEENLAEELPGEYKTSEMETSEAEESFVATAEAEEEFEGEEGAITGAGDIGKGHHTGEKPVQVLHKRRSSKEKETDIGIASAFEKLLLEKLIPYLDREMGFHLPKIPTPLPNLNDLYKSFHDTFDNKDQDTISAVQFLQSVLPHRSQSINIGPIFWHRTHERVATHMDLNMIHEMYSNYARQQELLDLEHEKLLGNEFLGDRISNLETFKGELKKEVEDSQARGERRGSVEIYGSGNQVFGIEDDGKDGRREDIRKEEPDPAITYIPFSERELSPKPFLWTTMKNCVHIPRNESIVNQLTTSDVMKIFRYLYPNVCGMPHEVNLDFEMTFCDWLWCMSLVSKVCADRELYTSMKDELPEPPNPVPESSSIGNIEILPKAASEHSNGSRVQSAIPTTSVSLIQDHLQIKS